MRCGGSVRESAGVPGTTSVYAAEGTVLHAIAAACLNEASKDPWDWIGQTLQSDGFDIEITAEKVFSMVRGLDWLREQPGQRWVEQTVALDPWLPDQRGTIDVLLWDPERRHVTVFDWKFGIGVPVSAVSNSQICIYAAGAIQNLLRPIGADPLTVSLIIEQPRCRGGGGRWDITITELKQFMGTVEAAAIIALSPNAPLVAGLDQCRYCPAKTRAPAAGALTGCTTHDRFLLDLVQVDFEALDAAEAVCDDLALPRNLSPERRSHVIRNAPMMRKWLDQLEDTALSDAVAGNTVPGFKAVIGDEGDREWRDAVAAEALLIGALADDAWNKKLKSPTQAEKALKPRKKQPGDPVAWDALTKIIMRKSGKPTLVSASDARPAIEPVDSHFDDATDPAQDAAIPVECDDLV
jgi:hypothetical protein